MKKLIYLASPYTHERGQVMDRRYRMACKATAAMIRDGWLVYSPIVHSVALVEHGGFPGSSWEDWEEFDLSFLERCDAFAILTLGGWRESRGVTAEHFRASVLQMQKFFVNLHDGDQRYSIIPNTYDPAMCMAGGVSGE